MAKSGLSRSEWTGEMACLQWALRQLRPDERDYLTKRLKHVLGKRTLKSSWYEKDPELLKHLVTMGVWAAGDFKGILLMAIDTDRMRSADYPGLPQDKTPEVLFQRLTERYRAGGFEDPADARAAAKEVLKQFAKEIEGLPYDRRAFGLLTVYITALGLASEGCAFVETMQDAFELSESESLPVECGENIFDVNELDLLKVFEDKPEDEPGEDLFAVRKEEKPASNAACGGAAAEPSKASEASEADAAEVRGPAKAPAPAESGVGTAAEACGGTSGEPERQAPSSDAPAEKGGKAGEAADEAAVERGDGWNPKPAPARESGFRPWALPPRRPVPQSSTLSAFYESERAGMVFSRDFSLSVPPLPRGATRYLGYIRTSGGGSFFNFHAVAEWYKDRFGALEAEAKRLFPTCGAFNLKSAGRNQLKEGAFYVVDLMASELVPNYDDAGRVRADFSKCVDFSKLTTTGRFFSASDFGIHIVAKLLTDPGRIDFTQQMIPVQVSDTPDLESEMSVVNELVVLEHRGLLYGPVRLKKDSSGKAYVTFSGLVNKGLVAAFREKADQVETVSEFVRWKSGGQAVHADVRCAKIAFMEPVSIDVWSDADLMRRTLEKSSVRAADLKELLERSALFEDVPEDVRTGRLERAKKVIGRLSGRDAARAQVADFVFEELKSGNAAVMEDVLARVAADEHLVEVFAKRSAVGRRLEELSSLEETLGAEIEAKRNKHELLNGQCARLGEANALLVKDLEAKRRALKLCGEKEDVVAAIHGLDASLEARRAEVKKLEALRTKLVEESKRISGSAAGAGGELMPETLQKAVAAWDEEDAARRRERLVAAVAGVRPAGLKGRTLADELVAAVQEVRRYDANTVLNLYICWVQNFLTVLSGEPGSGKTSICHILAQTLGLDAFDGLIGGHERAGFSAGRFVHVPVEYGWTSKRDFIGYWNPITNRFESSDPARWNLLCTLNAEARSAAGSIYPAMMLLDEANLSPMEYYWSDWMRLCDERSSSGVVTLWDKSPTIVPETLRFMATINNDSTTETLSPRLIDRAAVVTLPVVECIEDASPVRVVGPVPWKEMQVYFGARSATKNAAALGKLNEALAPVLEGFGIRLSPRSIRQINGYLSVASSIFSDGDKPAWLDAADFAMMQKCLPRITGTGARYREKLVDLRRSLESLGLTRSAEVVQRIVRQGDEAMDCYRFF